jgi:uncharacterized protein YycO
MGDTQLDRLQQGDLIFYKVTPQSWWLARLIAAVQLIRKEGTSSTYYSHVGLLNYDKDEILEGTWPESCISNIDWKDPSIEVWRIKNLNGLQRHAAMTWAHCHLSRPYDVGQILLGLFTWSSAYTCSEFVLEAYRNVGIDLAPHAGRFLGPNELITDKLERIK